MKARSPTLEADRLEALRQYRILDTPPEQTYDDITSLAAFICDVPIALISLVDTDRQWFKSKVGLHVNETPRNVSFCTHAILSKNILVVNDALLDERFVNNPLVTSAPRIRFYAGVPLVTPHEQSIGTLCVLDQHPRDLSESQKKALESLARQVVVQLELKRVSEQLAEALGKIDLMAGLIPICSYCKGIRNDEGYWSSVEKFIEQFSNVEFTHGVCDACIRKHFPEIAASILDWSEVNDDAVCNAERQDELLG